MAEATDAPKAGGRRKSAEGAEDEDDEAGGSKKRGRPGKATTESGKDAGGGGDSKEIRGRAAELAEVLMHGARGVMVRTAAGGAQQTICVKVLPKHPTQFRPDPRLLRSTPSYEITSGCNRPSSNSF